MNPILKTGIVALLLTTTPTVFAAWDELGTSEFITVPVSYTHLTLPTTSRV